MTILAKTYFCQSGFYHGKMTFCTVWQKPVNPGDILEIPHLLQEVL